MGQCIYTVPYVIYFRLNEYIYFILQYVSQGGNLIFLFNFIPLLPVQCKIIATSSSYIAVTINNIPAQMNQISMPFKYMYIVFLDMLQGIVLNIIISF